MHNITQSSLWKKLERQYYLKKDTSLKEMFQNDNNRFEDYSIHFDDIFFDYSKNLIDEEIFPLLALLAEKCNLRIWITKLFNGTLINNTEHRAALHTALRNKSSVSVIHNEENISIKINKVLLQMKEFSDAVHSKKHIGVTGKAIDTIVNIGIGGSHLGPEMVCQALKPYAVDGMKAHFVSNVDSSDICEVLQEINLETTIFIIASKTFTTQETMTNAETAKSYFIKKLGNEGIDKHFIAVSTNIPACQKFGIDEKNIFEFWDWVGGRYSLWSSIGISIALYLGFENFDKLLGGAYKADEHFRKTPFMENIPVVMALLDVWYTAFHKTTARAVIPYDNYLSLFPMFLQQLEMESNGKSVKRNGERVDTNVGQIIWGAAGTNAQHSFFQFLHQATQIVPIDFIAACQSQKPKTNHQDILISNMIAQGEAMMIGKTENEALAELEESPNPTEEFLNLLPYKVFDGNRPVTTILVKKMTPDVLGRLIAIYEHKVFVQGIIWDVNSFDQWGVELGKQLSKSILSDIEKDEEITEHDSSTNGLINLYKKWKK